MLNFTNPHASLKLFGLQCFMYEDFPKVSDNEQSACIIGQ